MSLGYQTPFSIERKWKTNTRPGILIPSQESVGIPLDHFGEDAVAPLLYYILRPKVLLFIFIRCDLMERPPFHLKVRIGDMEIELGGDKDEVLSTLDELPLIVGKVTNAFEMETMSLPEIPERVAAEATVLDIPKIGRTSKCGDAVVALLTTDWGNNPRSISELREAMEANAIFFPKTTLSGVLVWLVKKGRVRRWKDKKKGYLYVINEPEEV